MLWRKVNAKANAARLMEGPRTRESHSYSKKAEEPNVITIQLGAGVTITATFPGCSPSPRRRREVVPCAEGNKGVRGRGRLDDSGAKVQARG